MIPITAWQGAAKGFVVGGSIVLLAGALGFQTMRRKLRIATAAQEKSADIFEAILLQTVDFPALSFGFESNRAYQFLFKLPANHRLRWTELSPGSPVSKSSLVVMQKKTMAMLLCYLGRSANPFPIS